MVNNDEFRKSEPRVSVVMPVYNGEQFLECAIKSILSQNYTDWEFLIVNEYGSSVEATAICEKYADIDERIVLIQNKSRLRIAESLNVGLRKSRGEYIVRMDADDISMPSRIGALVRYMDEHKDIDICGSRVEMFGDKTWDWKVETNPEILKCAALFSTPFVHPTVIMRKKSLVDNNLEYDVTFAYTEDFEFFERASHVLNFSNIDYSGYYKYRFFEKNATNIGGKEGILYEELVVKRAMLRFGIKLNAEEMRILSYAAYPIANSYEEAIEHFRQLDLILKKVFTCDGLRDKYGIDILFNVLHRRWEAAYERNRYNTVVCGDERFHQAYHRGVFHNENWPTNNWGSLYHTPVISVVIPTYNSEDYIMDTMFSIVEQDFKDIEIIVVNEIGSDDNTVKIIKLFNDQRIKVLQNNDKLGLADSLNRGFAEARGEFIARADAGDVYPLNRFSKQLFFLKKHPDVSVCGTYQRYFGNDDRVHMPPVSCDDMKASLLFKCEVCHSTVMLRRNDFIDNGIKYDSQYLSEDYELWARIAYRFKFATLPEILGEYRWDGNNITQSKKDRLDIEAKRIVARNLKENLGILVAEEDLVLLSGWENPFWGDTEETVELRKRELCLLNEILQKNSSIRAYEESSLRKVIDERLKWAGISVEDHVKVSNSEINKPAGYIPERISIDIPHHGYAFVDIPQSQNYQPDNRHKDSLIKRLIKAPLRPFYRVIRRHLEDRLINLERESCIQRDELARLFAELEENRKYYRECAQASANAMADIINRAQESLTWNINHLFDEDYKNIGVLEQELQKNTSVFVKQCEAIHEHINDVNEKTSEMVKTIDENVSDVEKKHCEMLEQIREATADASKALLDQVTDLSISTKEGIIDGNRRIEELKAITDSRIWKSELFIKSENEYVLFLLQRISCLNKENKKAIILGTPYHSNLGDHAQTYCIRKWIEANYPDYLIVEIDSPHDDNRDMYPFYELLKEKISRNDRVFVQSGCHLTDLFENEMESLIAAVDVLKGYCPIIAFPQTVYFANKERAEEISEKLRNVDNLMLMTRGNASHKCAKDLMLSKNILMLPDIVNTLIGNKSFESSKQRVGFVMCKRPTDKENGIDIAKLGIQLDAVKEKVGECWSTDTDLDCSYEEIKVNREFYIKNLVCEMSKRLFVITDRMHGLIFSLISGTPVIVLKTGTPKVASAAEWYLSIPEFKKYVYLCEKPEELVDLVGTVLDDAAKRKELESFTDKYYGNLKEEIETFIENYYRGKA